jgi:hypothetical protein
MQNFDDRLLLMVDRVTGKFNLMGTLLDRVLTRIAPQATAMAQSCPSLCYVECSGVCGGGDAQYAFNICSYDYTGCSRGETWSNYLGCDC